MQRLIALLSVFLLALGCGDESPTGGGGLEPGDIQSAVIEPVTSTDSVATPRETVSISVRVVDIETGDPRGDIRVRFRLSDDRCGGLEFGLDRTDGEGLASDFWHVGQDALTCELSASTVSPTGDLVDTAVLTFEVLPGDPHRHVFDNRAFREYDPLVLPREAWRDKLANPIALNYRAVVTAGPAHVLGETPGTEEARTIKADTSGRSTGRPDTLATGRVAVIRGGDTIATGELVFEAHEDGTTVCADFPPTDDAEHASECGDVTPAPPN